MCIFNVLCILYTTFLAVQFSLIKALRDLSRVPMFKGSQTESQV